MAISSGPETGPLAIETLRTEILDCLASAVALVDPSGRVLMVNAAWDRGARQPIDAFSAVSIGDNLLAACRGVMGAASAVQDHVAEGISRVLAGKAPRFELEHEVETIDGSRWFLLVVTEFPSGGAVISRTDTTVHHTVHEVFSDLAFHDALTGLPNRWLVLDRLRMALGRAARRATWATVVFADLDDFKGINDRLGHGVGDQVLVTIGRRFSEALRAEDTCGRWGGDEFVMVLEVEDPAYLHAILGRLRGAAAEPIPLLGGGSVTTGGSLGIACVRADVTADTVVRLADEAMYKAKLERQPVLCQMDGTREPRFGVLAAAAT